MKTLVMSLLVMSMLFLGGCGFATPNAGVEGVLVKQPLIFGHGGVDTEPVKTGRTIVALTTDVVYVDMRPQQRIVELDDLMTKEGVPIDFHASISLRCNDSVRVVEKFGGFDQMYTQNIEQEFQNIARQAVRKHGMNETAIDTTAIEQIDAEVTQNMIAYIKMKTLPIDTSEQYFRVTMGKANPPDAIKTQRVETATQEQRVETEKKRLSAENQRLAAEQARAKADNAYREDMQLSPNQFLQLEQIKMLHDVCGKGTCTFIMGGQGSGVSPVLNVK